MFGTSEDTFGEGPFGFADWSRVAVYGSLPNLHCNIDQNGDLCVVGAILYMCQGGTVWSLL